MAVTHYSFSLLEHKDSVLKLSPSEVSELLKTWRNGHYTSKTCLTCRKTLSFEKYFNFTTCCKYFYYKPSLNYMVRSISVPTPGYNFLLPNLDKTIQKKNLETNQDFLVLADAIFWQVPTTLIYDKCMKFVTQTPITKKTKQIQPASKSSFFYKQIQEAPLIHGSFHKRSGGKNTFFRQIAFGKRCTYSARGMIVPDAALKPNEITLPQLIQSRFHVLGKWIILNRMPSLQPENFVALKVANIWKHDCFGLPLEIIRQMNADFDGDECNIYIFQNVQSQAECEMVLNSAWEMKSFTSGLKLAPCQDMLVAYYLFWDEIDFLPYKNRSSLTDTFRVIYDLYGSHRTFQCFDAMRQFYLNVMKNRLSFAITKKEIQDLEQKAHGCTYEEFKVKVENNNNNNNNNGCLVTQIQAEAKGSFYHLYLMFGSIGNSNEHSFWEGLTPLESVQHAMTTIDSLEKSSNIWQPGYGYSKSVYNLQGLHVDYLGQLVDGNDLIVEEDVIDAMHYTDLLSKGTFLELIQRHLIQ